MYMDLLVESKGTSFYPDLQASAKADFYEMGAGNQRPRYLNIL